MIKAIAIDDEPPALKIIQEFCSKTDIIQLQKTFTKPTEALKHLHKFPADLLFLDIQMPSMTGIQFYKSIPQTMMIIFTTAHSQYAIEGFNLNALDYLLKPFTYKRFLQSVNKANEYFKFHHPQDELSEAHFFIRADYSLIKIVINTILYIKGLDDYLKIHLSDDKTIVARMTMKAMLEKLPAKDFIRVHRSFIVPVSKIKSIRKKNISVADIEIPIGLSYEQNLLSLFKK
jgi:DNA-binding LytR/AlgR family response regulator